MMYANGFGVTKNLSEAFKWYKLAAEQGLAQAQYDLAAFYDKGLVVQQSYTKAIKWYELAAAQGIIDAQYSLGLIYLNPSLDFHDMAEEGVRLIEKAAEQGSWVALYTRGSMALTGLGVPKSDSDAAKWFRLAAENGDVKLKKSLIASPNYPVQAEPSNVELDIEYVNGFIQEIKLENNKLNKSNIELVDENKQLHILIKNLGGELNRALAEVALEKRLRLKLEQKQKK